jgi:hypothetical protein
MSKESKVVLEPDMEFEAFQSPAMDLMVEERPFISKELLKQMEAEKIDETIASIPEMEKGPFILLPIPVHYQGLTEEIYYRSNLGKNLLLKQHEQTFKTIPIMSRLIVSGTVWNVPEIAEFGVKVFNDTFFDLKDMKVKLYVNGPAVIINPPGHIITYGDMIYGNPSVEKFFKVKATGAGQVTLSVVLEGKIGACKKVFKYDGTYWTWDSSKWMKNMRPEFRRTYTIYPS